MPVMDLDTTRLVPKGLIRLSPRYNGTAAPKIAHSVDRRERLSAERRAGQWPCVCDLHAGRRVNVPYRTLFSNYYFFEQKGRGFRRPYVRWQAVSRCVVCPDPSNLRVMAAAAK